MRRYLGSIVRRLVAAMQEARNPLSAIVTRDAARSLEELRQRRNA